MRGAVSGIILILAVCSSQTAGADDATWWSFRPVERPALPDTTDGAWAASAIDQFVLARLEPQKLAPSAAADPATLFRRVSLDLTGLPPTPEDVDAFATDENPDAYARLVDRLLASPRYGERWGRHWLDTARYADSTGGEMDFVRPMWRYRDWVIDALNRDLPFDEFLVTQVAGDLLPDATDDHLIATGFYRCGVYDPLAGNGSDEVARLNTVIDRVNTTGTVFLGLTIGCARCHTHKFDPISIEEYYQIFAFFNDVDDGFLGLPTKDTVSRHKARREQIKSLEKELAAYEEKLKTKVRRWELNLDAQERKQFPAKVQAALSVGPEIRGEADDQIVFDAFKGQDGGYLERRSLIDRLLPAAPTDELTPVTYQRKEPRTTNVFLRGNFKSRGAAVVPGVPAAFPALTDRAVERRTRLDLAEWLVRPDNPLTARVTVNRIWQRLHGQGLVRTENDFGKRGALPTHPKLLDWLSAELVDDGWSLKALHRTLVSSATYRQSSRLRDDLAQKDADNLFLARQTRLRLEAESIRDVTLAAAGLLSAKIGGPSVFPRQSPGVLAGRATPEKWTTSEGEDRYRRGMYTHFWRLTPHPFLRMFDAPEALTACTRRYRSNTPLQALTLLNDPTFVEAAEVMAQRVLAFPAEGDATRAAFAFRICVAREPSAAETQLLLGLLAARRSEYAAAPALAQKLLTNSPKDKDSVELASWTAVCRAILNLDELITRG